MNSQKHKRILGECLDFLENNGFDVSKELLKLIEFFFFTDSHLSLADLCAFAEKNKLGLQETSISDLFKLLVEYGFATEKVFGDNVIRFEHHHIGEHHDHFYCIKCGRIFEFCSPLIEDAQIKEALNIGFHAFSHKMQIHGLCKSCFGKSCGTPLFLSMVDSGGNFQITDIVSDNSHRNNAIKQRLYSMGLVSGVKGEVISNHKGRVVFVAGGTRMALEVELSKLIRVELVN